MFQRITCPGCHDILRIDDRQYAQTVCKPCDLAYYWSDTDADKPYCSILVPHRLSTGEPRADMPIFIQCVGCGEHFYPAQLAHCSLCHAPHCCTRCLDIAIGVTARDGVAMNACWRCHAAQQEQEIAAPLLARIAELEAQRTQPATCEPLPLPTAALSLDDRILALIGDAVWHVDDIVRELDAPIVEVSATLGMMEIFGKVKNLGGMNIQAARLAVAA